MVEEKDSPEQEDGTPEGGEAALKEKAEDLEKAEE